MSPRIGEKSCHCKMCQKVPCDAFNSDFSVRYLFNAMKISGRKEDFPNYPSRNLMKSEVYSRENIAPSVSHGIYVAVQSRPSSFLYDYATLNVADKNSMIKSAVSVHATQSKIRNVGEPLGNTIDRKDNCVSFFQEKDKRWAFFLRRNKKRKLLRTLGMHTVKPGRKYQQSRTHSHHSKHSEQSNHRPLYRDRSFSSSGRLEALSKISATMKRMDKSASRSVSRIPDEANQDFFELLERMQGNRLEDQRCELPAVFTERRQSEPSDGKYSFAKEILRQNPPYPMVVISPSGGYWVDGAAANCESSACKHHSSECCASAQSDCRNSFNDIVAQAQSVANRLSPLSKLGCASCDETRDFNVAAAGNNKNSCRRFKLESDETAKCYRRYFYDRDHFNFYALDPAIGPLVLSVRTETISSQERFRIILRTVDSTLHELIPATCLGALPTAARMAKLLKEEITTDMFHPVMFPKGSDMILTYDEHVLVTNYKFGVIYQKYGQITEEELFGNVANSPEFDEFLQFLGEKVELKNFNGYRGGLDTINDQTGRYSIHTNYKDREIMFHVTTMLPYTPGDLQQLQRKRHIGNDIVSLIFQQDDTPFVPDSIASHFLHAFLVVRPFKNDCSKCTQYKVSVTARSDVPFFGPTIPCPAIFSKDSDFRQFILAKLINAENACYKAERFSKLANRTRSSLLETLYQELKRQNLEHYGYVLHPELSKSPHDRSPGNNLLDSVKKAFAGTNRTRADYTASSPSIHKKYSVPGFNNLKNNEISSRKTQSSADYRRRIGVNKRTNTTGLIGIRKYGLAYDRCEFLGAVPASPADQTPVSGASKMADFAACKERLLSSDSACSSGTFATCRTAISTPSHTESKSPESLTLKDKPKSRSISVGNVTSGDYDTSSNHSFEIENDSDTGMESMSSADTSADIGLNHHLSMRSVIERNNCCKEYKRLQECLDDLSKLKQEKHQLMRQNVTCKFDLKKMKDRENRLSAELHAAHQEINKLRQILKMPPVGR